MCHNTSCLIRKNFSPEWAGIIEKDRSQAIYRKGYSVFEQGMPASGLFFVQKGLVREYVSGGGGRTDIFRFVKAGEVFGHTLINNSYSVSAEAKVDSAVCFFDNNTLYELYRCKPVAVYDFMQFYSNEHSEFVQRLMRITKMSLRQKVASVLYYLYRHFGINTEKELPDCFNREDIAGLAMTNAEQVSRQLSDFEQEKIIEKRARKIAIMQPSKLKAIIKDHMS